MRIQALTVTTLILLGCTLGAQAGNFSPGKGGPDEAGFIDAGIPGHIGGPDGPGDVDPGHGSYVNPVFKGWATGAVYEPADNIGDYAIDWIPGPPDPRASFSDPSSVLGEVAANSVLCLGDMDQDELEAWRAGTGHGPGTVTLSFDSAITNGSGADFAAFENGFVSDHTTAAGSVRGEIWAELAYVEVSTDGSHFARFPSIYNNFLDGPPATQDYLTLDASNIYNLVGKHANAYGTSFGTPFDLDDLLNHQLVLDGLVDLDEINFVRLVDIPGDGSFVDSQGNAIYDPWLTWGTGGADIDALGVINQVPEPATMAMLGLGGLILGRRSRKTN